MNLRLVFGLWRKRCGYCTSNRRWQFWWLDFVRFETLIAEEADVSFKIKSRWRGRLLKSYKFSFIIIAICLVKVLIPASARVLISLFKFIFKKLSVIIWKEITRIEADYVLRTCFDNKLYSPVSFIIKRRRMYNSYKDVVWCWTT